MKRPFALLSVLLALVLGPARAADIDAGASLDSIRITSSFTGAQVLIFGTILGQMNPTPDTDVVVELKGPVGDFVVRRKEPIGPIWLNQDRTKFHAVPGFYFVASTRPLNEIAPNELLTRYQLGLNSLQLEPMKRPRAGDVQVYGEAFIAEMREAGLYTEISGTGAIESVGPSLFSTRIDLPEIVPVGNYTVRVLLLKNGSFAGDKTWTLPVEKSGLESWLYNAAHDVPALFGFAAVLVSVFFGWAASMFFRRPA